MGRFARSPSKIVNPQRKGVAQRNQYGVARKGAAICEHCRNVFYRKRWQRASMGLPLISSSNTRIYFVVCPACQMAKNRLFEGELILKNVPARYEHEFIRLVEAYGRRAKAKDPQDRILGVQRRRSGFRVTTTENQLAVRLAKKIRESFHDVDIRITHSREPYEVSRVVATFPKF